MMLTHTFESLRMFTQTSEIVECTHNSSAWINLCCRVLWTSELNRYSSVRRHRQMNLGNDSLSYVSGHTLDKNKKCMYSHSVSVVPLTLCLSTIPLSLLVLSTISHGKGSAGFWCINVSFILNRSYQNTWTDRRYFFSPMVCSIMYNCRLRWERLKLCYSLFFDTDASFPK